VGSRGEWKESRGRPAEEEDYGVREERAHPAKVALYRRSTAGESRVALRAEGASKEDRKK
jgi:hypothetical protein